MRSFVKIYLAIKSILLVLIILGFLALLIDALILPIKVAAAMEELHIEPTEHLTIIAIAAIAALIIAISQGLSLFACLHMIKRLNVCEKKYQLTGSIIFLILTFSFIPALLVIFTPSKYIAYQNPYFE